MLGQWRRKKKRRFKMTSKATEESRSGANALEIGSRSLLYFGFFWIVAGGLVPFWVGIRQIAVGSIFEGSVSVAIGALILFCAWLMKNEIK